MKHGIIYCRVSSKEQIEGTSLESQELACREFARNKNISIAKIFVGRGESAKFADRPELLELLDYSKTHKGELDTLLVWKLDRLARNVNDHFNIKATLLKYGIDVISVTEPIDSNPEGKLLETILAGFAQFDNDVRAMRTVQGMRRKLQEGILPRMPPLGYRTATSNHEKKVRPDEANQPTFGLLQKAWKTFATGAYSKAEMKRLMTDWGIVTRKGLPISDQSLDNLFRNPYYAGTLIDSWSGEEYEGKHPAMVTRADFARVQQVLTKRNRSLPHQRIRSEFPMRGTVRCPNCQRYMTSSFSRGRNARYAYYHCNLKDCGGRGYYPAEVVHNEFGTLLQRIAISEEGGRLIRESIIAMAEERQKETRKITERKRERLSRISPRLSELIRMRTENLITDAEFGAEKAALVQQRSKLEAQSLNESLSVRNIQDNLDRILAPLTNLRETWDALPTKLKQRFQQLLLPVGFIAGESGTADIGRLFKLFQQFKSPISHRVAPVGESWNQLMQEIATFATLFDRSKDENVST